MIAFGASDMTKAYVGSTEGIKAYLGDELVWGGESTVLPYDAEVAYLQSSGTQYINLPMTVASGTYFEVDIYFVPIYKNTNTYSVFSANPYQQFEGRYYSRNTSSNTITYSSTVGTISSGGGWSGIIGQENHVTLSTASTVGYTGVVAENARPLTAKITAFRIFGGYRNSNRYPIAFRKFKITAGTTVLYDLISVRKDGVGYMYDKISGELFGNSGSGSFTIGSDIS